MSSRLAPQEDATDTYYAQEMIRFCIDNRLRSGSQEWEVSRVWNDILHYIFSTTEGFSVGLEMQVGTGRVDLFSSHLVLTGNNTGVEFKFLVVECKAPALDGQDLVWYNAALQLEGYLSELLPLRLSERMWGAVAVGNCVRFYTYDRNRMHVESQLLRLDRQCQTIHGILDGIKADRNARH
ncbi:hypothetical protein G6O67_000987 [Ophiocordyceps sinensis]|uniref:Uncharacterized protein n=1 Tax=Ophiocordyceps sinensis TaxID=72228 RepID=A0A8H4V8M0_9HYPO|nr:hypothetical protein G6O67_000987 [Ophiocordyceps sinensis]